MIRWRAIAFGLAVQVTLLFAAVLVPLVGHAAAGLAGGFVAGVLAGGDKFRGWEHGAVTGVAGAALAVAVGVALALVVGLGAVVPDPVAAAFGPAITAGEGVPLVVLGALVLVVCADSAGALGGWLRGERRFPGRADDERPRSR